MISRWLAWSLVAAYGTWLTPAAGAQRYAIAPVDYNHVVRPLLSESCFSCHGPDTAKRQAGLRLDTADGAYKTLPSGKVALVPGDLKASALIDRVSRHDALQMPPRSSGKKLTPAQIMTLRFWVAQGAKYAPHWAYVPIPTVRPPDTPSDPSANKLWKWARTPIDRFLLARMQSQSFQPSPAADRSTLLRRLSLDLTGLPPAPAEIDAFLRDQSPNAYEKQVDRLLASPHYGERMAVSWLDQVRYADTVGYHGDQDMSVWPYRDYIVRAFNANKRFDVFTREQLAGDLLPHPTQEQLTASGYNRLGMMSAEGGIQDKEYLAKYFGDRVRNASIVWLGATIGCAECHDHKYDPYTQKDFYRFGAFFADLNEHGFYGGGFPAGDWGPRLSLATPEQTAALAKLDAEIAAAHKVRDAISNDTLAMGRAQWEKTIRAMDAAGGLGWTPVTPTTAESSGGSTLTAGSDGVVSVSGKLPAFDVYTLTLPANRPAITALRLETFGDENLPGNGIARAGTFFVISDVDVATQEGSGPLQPVKLASVAVGGEDEGYPGVAMLDGNPHTGWASLFSGNRTAVFRPEHPIQGGPNTRLVVRIHQEMTPRLEMGRFRLSLSGVAQADLSAQGVADNVLAAVRKDPAQRAPAEQDAIAAAYRAVAPELEEARNRVAALEGERSILQGQIPKTLISQSQAPRTIRVLPRGNWMNDTGEVVEPGVPHFLRQPPVTGRATRLDLANWIVAPDNPLTARVFVNRLWKLFYGVGLTKNLDDFGIQGEMPLHPELLDWLAHEFIRSGWDVKRMVRLMVTTNAYRQTSTLTPALAERDPYNRYYARQTAFRMDAEFVHDAELKIAGELSERVGGESVYPYQPRGYLTALNFPRREWATGAGEELYRRGLYTHWQRSFLHPAMLAFDAPSREEAVCTRAVSNTPMQALVLMDDPEYVEAARVFAEHILRRGGATLDQKLNYAYRSALARTPQAAELPVLRRLYTRMKARYASDPKSATALVSAGDWPVAKGLDPADLAAWATVARAIMNLHETITRN